MTILREVLGLFVDDGSFALLILAWLAVEGFVLPRLGISSAWNCAVLFAGLALILIESVARRAKR